MYYQGKEAEKMIQRMLVLCSKDLLRKQNSSIFLQKKLDNATHRINLYHKGEKSSMIIYNFNVYLMLQTGDLVFDKIMKRRIRK